MVRTVPDHEEAIWGDSCFADQNIVDDGRLGDAQVMATGILGRSDQVAGRMALYPDDLLWVLPRDLGGDAEEYGSCFGPRLRTRRLEELVGGHLDADDVPIRPNDDTWQMGNGQISDEAVVRSNLCRRTTLHRGSESLSSFFQRLILRSGVGELNRRALQLPSSGLDLIAEELDLLSRLGQE